MSSLHKERPPELSAVYDNVSFHFCVVVLLAVFLGRRWGVAGAVGCVTLRQSPLSFLVTCVARDG